MELQFDNLNDYALFAKVVEHGGFAPAARALGLAKSTLSRRIAALEDHLQARLIQRSSRRFAVTETGRIFFARAQAMLVEAEAARDAVARLTAEPAGLLRVSCPPPLLCFSVGAMLNQFLERYPQVSMELESTPRRVDLVAEGIDVAVRVRFPPLDDSDVIMKILGESQQRLVGHPRLVAASGKPMRPADLHGLPSLGLSSGRRDHEWHLFGPNGADVKVVHQPRFVTDDMIELRRAAVAGLGIVQLPLDAVAADLGTGALIDLLPEWAPRAGIVHAVYTSRRGLLPSVRALIDFLGQAFDAAARRPDLRAALPR